MTFVDMIPSAKTSFVGEFLAWMACEADPSQTIQKVVAQVTQRVALPVFALIDATYHLTCALIKLPFMLFKATVASAFGFSGVIPDTLGGADEWVEHAKKTAAAALAVISGCTLGLVSPDMVIDLCDKMGLKYIWLSFSDFNNLPQTQQNNYNIRIYEN